MVCAGAFLQCSLDAGIFAGFFPLDIPSRGAWKNRGMCQCFFCWPLVQKLVFHKTLLCVVICVNENWVALLFQEAWSCVL